jgi:1,2-diacylglycerol 3-alpha-glucosyltransferase
MKDSDVRVGIMSVTYVPNLNGVSISVHRLTENLRVKGMKTFIVTSKMKNVKYPKYVLPVPSFPMPKYISPDMKFPIYGIWEAYRFFTKNKINIINSTDPFITATVGRVFSTLMNIPHIYTFHTHFETYGYFSFPGYKNIVRRVLRSLCNHAAQVTTPSDKIRQYLLGLHVHTPIQTLINIPRIEHLHPVPKNRKLMEKYGINAKDFVFITFGRVNKEKSLDVGVKMMVDLVQKNPHIKYIIAGLGPMEKVLQKLSKKLGIEKNIIITGKYEQSELNDLANLGDCFLFTSRTDTQAITLLEAMCCGLPVMAVDDDCVDYIVKDGYNGYKRKEKDLMHCCEKVIKDKKLYAMLSRNALKSSKTMSEASITRDWMTLYKKVVAQYKKKNHSLGRKKGLARDMFDKTYRTIMHPFAKYKNILLRLKK